ncbi:MAG: hypothetical protein LKI17_01190 [Megasphaera cerevisiae]|jgi:hypothetical protein|nr:hypothetical protein [Megasphaera cerevisiae]
MKKIVSGVMIMTMTCLLGGTANASWLSSIWNNAATSNTSTQATTTTMQAPDANSSRWMAISSNQYFTTYADKRSLQATGTAQNRQVSGFFKEEFTPVGSQWLGEKSNGRVKPDVITHVIYHAYYGVNSHGYNGTTDAQYYDVHNNLIYQGKLIDFSFNMNDGSCYIPDSEQEQVKDTLFKAFGWNY